VLDESNKALRDMQLVVDALTRGKPEEALLLLKDVRDRTERIERFLSESMHPLNLRKGVD
jgi:hypothetical protein